MPADTFALTAGVYSPQGTGLSSVPIPVVVTAGETLTRDIVLVPTGMVDVLLRDGAGNPKPSFRVELLVAGFSRGGYTDTSGHLLFPDVPVGTYTVQARDTVTGVYSTKTVLVAQDQTTAVDLSLVAVGSLAVQVNYAAGPAASNVHVYLAPNQNGIGRSKWTGASGAATLTSVTAGDYTVVAEHPVDYRLKASVAASVTVHGAAVPVMLVLPAIASVRVTALQESGSPYAGLCHLPARSAPLVLRARRYH